MMNEKKLEKLKELNRYVSMYCFDKTVPGGTQKTVELLDLLHECEQALAPEPRFYVGQPVLVTGSLTSNSYPKHLRKINGKSDYLYECIDGTEWSKCKPDPDAVSLPNWIEHDGSEAVVEIPHNCVLMIDWKSGSTFLYERSELIEGIKKLHRDVVHYAFIPLPEFL